MLEELRDKRVAIVGYGLEGKATLEYLNKHGIGAAVADYQTEEALRANNAELIDTEVIAGADYLSKLDDFDVLIKTPGIPYLNSEIQGYIAAGKVVTSQLEIFLELCPAKTVGITGTKGKGTTSTLITRILEKKGVNVFLGGNIGLPAISFLDEVGKEDLVVLELSSFQLQPLKKSPNVAVLLNVTSEHLDHHISTEEYRDAKMNILRFQQSSDIAVISGDYEVPQKMSASIKAAKYYFSRYKTVTGCYVDEQDRIVFDLNGNNEVLMPANEVMLRGRFNLENVTAAALVGKLLGVSDSSMREVIKKFSGLPHRLEFICEKNNIRYYNDSFSTVPETAVAAISAFSDPVVLILGGSSKNSDFSELVKVLESSENIRAIVYIGKTGKEISELVGGKLTGGAVFGGKTMAEIVRAATKLAKAGDIVLLSPASASFGLFKNYKDRGDQFREVVNNL